MEKALSQILLNASSVSELVGDNVAPLRREDQVDSISYERTGREQEVFMNGQLSTLITSEFTLTCRGSTYQKAKAISEAATLVLQSLRGVYYGIKIMLCQVESEHQSQVFDEDISEITLSCTIHHN